MQAGVEHHQGCSARATISTYVSSADRDQDKSNKTLQTLNKISPVYILLCKQIYIIIYLNYANCYYKPMLTHIFSLLHEHNTEKYIMYIHLNDAAVMLWFA